MGRGILPQGQLPAKDRVSGERGQSSGPEGQREPRPRRPAAPRTRPAPGTRGPRISE